MQIHKTVESLAKRIKKKKLEFDMIVAIGTGGFIPARIMKTYLKLPILTVGIRYYDDDNKPIATPKKIQWIDEVEQKIENKKVLLVDEIDDSRSTLVYCLTELMRHKPSKIAVAVLHNKLKEKRAEFPKGIQYFRGEDLEDHWVIYPWDAEDIEEHTMHTREFI